METKINIPDRIFRILKEAGRLDLIQEWVDMALESMGETLYVGDLIE